MSELILELYTEEIPAFMQRKAEEAYYKIFTNILEAEDIMYQSIKLHVGPRRVVMHIAGMPEKSLVKHLELKGPKVGAPEQAIEGFCKTNNIDKNDLVIKSVKGQDCYMYESVKPEMELTEILPNLLGKAISEYIWPKSMNWGAHEMRWVRPMLNILCIFNGKILDFSYFHLKANNKSFGHRFIAAEEFTSSNWVEYLAGLKKSHVILERSERIDIIKRGLEEIQESKNLNIEIDEKLLEEVSGLVEYPKVLLGNIPAKFLHIPNEILSLAMKTHQRYFTTRTKNGEFAPYFVFVSNLPNASTEIVEGNEKVLSARLADAAYFYNQDQKTPLLSRFEKLKEVVFHAKLGSIYDKVTRLIKLVEYLKPGDQNLALAAKLCKCDLATEAVAEFPELQGIMGSYYASLEGASKETSLAIRNHYLPLGNNDETPIEEAAFLSIVDKIDSLVGLMLAGERATGSKDPYALRRYALGIIKIIVKNQLEGISLIKLIEYSMSLYNIHNIHINTQALADEILKFLEERLKYYMKEDYNIDAINAAVDLSIDDDLYIVEKKIKALHYFMHSEKGDMLLHLYKRVTNILGGEEVPSVVDESKFTSIEERNLYDSVKEVIPKIAASLYIKDFESAFSILNLLEEVISKFFDNVLVNDTDVIVAQNRKSLLSQISNIFKQIARFEKL